MNEIIEEYGQVLIYILFGAIMIAVFGTLLHYVA